VPIYLAAFCELSHDVFGGLDCGGDGGFLAPDENVIAGSPLHHVMKSRAGAGKPVIGVCQYAANLFPPDVLRRVLDAHRIAIEKTMISVKFPQRWRDGRVYDVVC